jgi:cortactin
MYSFLCLLFSVIKLAEEVKESDAQNKKKLRDEINPGFGYGGKFGVETDRMDKTAVGNEYSSPLMKHESQKDYKKGFGGSFGVQKDRVDKVVCSLRKAGKERRSSWMIN